MWACVFQQQLPPSSSATRARIPAAASPHIRGHSLRSLAQESLRRLHAPGTTGDQLSPAITCQRGHKFPARRCTVLSGKARIAWADGWTFGQVALAVSAAPAVDSQCPPCTVPVTVHCFGIHSSAQCPCSSAAPFSCSIPCGRPLPCGNHTCSRPCHLLGVSFYSHSLEICYSPNKGLCL